MPDTVYRQVDPLLARDGQRIRRLQKDSPAIGAAAKDDCRGITVDMDGQLRKAPLDEGADQYAVAPVKARVPHKADVGQEADARYLHHKH